MRTLPLTLAAALAATLLLTACDDGKTGDDDAKNADPANGSACAIGDLGVEVGAGAAPAAGDTGNVTVTLTNQGAQCTLKGFPAVDLAAEDSTTSVSPVEGAKAQPLTLGKGGTTSFTITYVRGEAGSAKSLAVRKASFTLPGAPEDAHDLTWSYGEVARRDGGGAAQASVSGFESSGD
ncbi:DUF4232 domain-containing protein [Streptomyces coeruleorubidus]|uniref:DUF4232 domain-containing protein n=1 Tax=Streptomyces coeruleorubidus TaxID=116188 RepID=A0A5J6I5W7_STRC4|nr:DUF4232 domain-containing protein [Streptomyces coeruleorubidus]QEV26922.1 DUF4232 domain-containing protein [Streptomyces coeruleorubidus]GGT62094.1 hypothetical protein GCM10010256_19290 [Streptomyces coeruleorubidus]